MPSSRVARRIGLCLPLAAWMRFVRRAARRGDRVNDPLAGKLLEIGQRVHRPGVGRCAACSLALDTVFPADLRNEPRFTRPLTRVYDGEDTSSFALPAKVRSALSRLTSLHRRGQPQRQLRHERDDQQHDQHRQVERPDRLQHFTDADAADRRSHEQHRSDRRRDEPEPALQDQDHAEVHGIDADRLRDRQERSACR